MSIRGSNQSPYRLPCDGTLHCSNGPRYQHGNHDPTAVDVWLYNAQVPDWATVDHNIDPYERYNPTDGCESDGAPPLCTGVDTCPDPTSADPPCLPWLSEASTTCTYTPLTVPVSWYQPDMLTAVTIADGGTGYDAGDILTLAGGTVSNYIGDGSGASTAIVIAVNGSGVITKIGIANPGSYETNPSSPNSPTGGHGTGASLNLTFAHQTMSFKNCFKHGYKNVQAARQWHGAPGYFFDLGPIEDYVCACDDTGDMCNHNFYHQYNYEASQTKYLDLEYSISFDYTINGAPYESASQSGTLSVDGQSGVIMASDIVNDDSSDYIESAYTQFGIPGLQGSPTDWLNFFASRVTCSWGETLSPSIDCGSDSSSGSDDDGDTISSSWTVGTTITGYYELDLTDESGSPSKTTVTLTGLSDSSLSFSCVAIGYYPSEAAPTETSVYTLSGTVTLSSPNTAADIQDDIATLLDEWDLSNDSQYPWRTDGNTSIAPLVTRNEKESNASPWDAGAPGVTVGWTDPTSGYYDGSIIGAPEPAGYQGYFDFAFVDFEMCETSDPPGLYLVGWGQKNTGQDGIPLNATQWSNNNTGIQFGPGAWIFYNLNPSWKNCLGVPDGYNFSPATTVWAQKWAETKMAFPSQDFFRPAGDDRFIYDEDFVFNISATSGGTIGTGSTITLEQTSSCGGVSTILTDTSGLWGGSAVGGFYKLTGISGSTVTLGTKYYNVPSDWSSASGDSANCFGKLRWSTGTVTTDPPPILGRAAISAIAEYSGMSLVTEITTESLPNVGMSVSSSDVVDIFDTNMISLASTLAVTRIDDTHFTVPVAHGTLTGAAWIMTHGAPHYYWDDQFSKGDYVYTDWTWWPRQICEANTYNTFITDCASTSTADDTTYGYACTGCPTDTQTVYDYPFSAFTQTAECLPFTPCNPAVICISPNGETFSDGHTFTFPTINFDEQYGSGWQAQIQQVMEDLLYQVPHYPAQGSGCVPPPSPCLGAECWEQDNGSCEGTMPDFYPHPPMVEARIALPTNGGASGTEDAPSLPSTPATCSVNQVVIGWSTPVGIISGDCTPPNTLFPPGYSGAALSQNVWQLWQNLCNSGSCFNYDNEVVGCP